MQKLQRLNLLDVQAGFSVLVCKNHLVLSEMARVVI
jgi:hypothetical protein